MSRVSSEEDPSYAKTLFRLPTGRNNMTQNNTLEHTKMSE
jgi:hypothetical protein